MTTPNPMGNNLYSPLHNMEEGACFTHRCFYHLSSTMLPDDYEFIPRIPSCTANVEDKYIPRICVSRSIEGALKALPSNNFGSSVFYVYKIIYDPVNMNILVPTSRAVFDAYITDELWVTTNIKPYQYKLVGVISNIYYRYNTVKNGINVNDYADMLYAYYSNTGGFKDTGGFKEKGYASYKEIYYTYRPFKITKSPFIYMRNNNEYQRYVEPNKIPGTDNYDEFDAMSVFRDKNMNEYFNDEEY